MHIRGSATLLCLKMRRSLSFGRSRDGVADSVPRASSTELFGERWAFGNQFSPQLSFGDGHVGIENI